MKKGFSLIELIVVIAIISVLFTALAAVFNPLGQIEKTRNSNRAQDLNQIKTALDTYYNDTGCYPSSVPFGSILSSGSTLYIQKVPEDPECSSLSVQNCYVYQTNGTICPQWNILYAQMHAPIVANTQKCVLNTASNCLPQGGFSPYNYCTVSGTLDCKFITQNPFPTPFAPSTPTPTPSGGGGGGGGGTPTPIPTPTPACSGNLSACSNGSCDIVQSAQCLGCGGSMQCYIGLTCGGVRC